MTIRWIRRTVQLAALLFFAWLIYQSRWVPGGHVAPPAFLRLDSLVVLTALLSRGPVVLKYLLPGIVLLVLTAVFGRFFCGWLCPLGTCIDISDSIFFRRRGGQRPAQARPRWKYYVLAAVLVAAVLGAQIGWLVDPIPLLTRTAATVIYPLSLGAYNLFINRAGPLLHHFGIYLYPARRMWCRSFCPLGALLALVGRFGIWKRYVTEQCTGCGLCSRVCKMGAIPADRCNQTDTAECILCYDCATCPQPGAMRIGLHLRMSGGANPATDISRRAFVSALGAGVAYGLLVRLGLRRAPVHPKLIRPPGANIRDAAGNLRRMTEAEFRELCVRCGNCMRACPTGGLQPAITQAGLDGAFTPVLVPAIGFCEQQCNACSQVCPTGALRPHTVEEKSRIKLGLAVIDRDRCLSWQKGSEYLLCLVCVEHCSYQAVVARKHRGQLRPFVLSDVCVGCGQCEFNCPAGQPAGTPSAITVSRRSSQ